MQDKTALVTGGIGTIGTEICERLLTAGARVIAVCTPPEREQAEAWLAERQTGGGRVSVVRCDLSDFEDTQAMVEKLKQEGETIDILINAAGITQDGPLKRMQATQWRAVLGANLDSVFNASRNVIEDMLTRGYGRIVNISSVNGQRGQFGQTNYSAAKAGMHGFTMALAREVASKGITVNTVSPGYIDSPMIKRVPENVRDGIRQSIPVGRFGTPADIARAVMFLVDDTAGYVTGTDISVNGGMQMG